MHDEDQQGTEDYMEDDDFSEEPLLRELTGHLDFTGPYIDEARWEEGFDY